MTLLSSTLLTVLVSCRLWSFAEGKRVVIVPMPLTSHTKYHTNIAAQLVSLGHELWMTVPDYLLEKGVLDLSNVKVVQYSPVTNVEEQSMHVLRDRYLNGEPEDFPAFIRIMEDFHDSFLKNETMMDEMRKIHPDLILIDNVLLKPLTIIPYRLGIPFAFAGTACDAVGQRVPFFPVVTPIGMLPFSDRMKFTERLQTTLLYIIITLLGYYNDYGIVSKYAPEMPDIPLDTLITRAELFLVEIDHILDYPRPSIPNVKLIGGTATGPAKPLPEKFQAFMDSAPEGVVIVSFGSYVLHLPEELSDKILRTLMQLPLKSVFRSNLVSPDPSKILTSSWIPQNDLLAHANTRVFLSHCGKNGQYEALYHAVPMVATPMFIDQAYNAERARVKGFAETVDLKTSTAEEIGNAVMKVATDKRYKHAIAKASELFRIEYGIPAERAAFWLDHVMKYGAAHMRSASQDMPFYQVLGLDVMVIVMSVGLVFSVLFGWCCCLSLRRLCCRREKQKEE